MKAELSIKGAALAVALSLSLCAATPVFAQECLGNREIQNGIAKGEFAPLSEALAEAGISASEEVLSVKVCQQAGDWVYVVSVLGQDGYARNLVLPAGY